MPFDKPKFEEKFGAEKVKETEMERKRRLGKESEWTIALPLFEELIEDGILSYVEHAGKEVDEKKGIDFVWGLEDRSHLAVQYSTAESKERWLVKIREVIGGEGERKGNPYEELKDIHPRPESLSRAERIERVPKILLRIPWGKINETYERFEGFSKQGAPFDFFENKEEQKRSLLIRVLANLEYYFTEKEIARRFPNLPRMAKQRYEVLNKSVEELLQRENRGVERCGVEK